MNFFGSHKEAEVGNLMSGDAHAEAIEMFGERAAICGCGKVARYAVHTGVFACNKSNRCPVDAEKHNFYISFATIDAKEADIIAIFGDGADSHGTPIGINNYKVLQQATKNYLHQIHGLQAQMRRQILQQMVPPYNDKPATEKEKELGEIILPNALNMLWDS